MVDLRKINFVLATDIADFKSPEYKLVIKKAKEADAHAKFGPDDYIARDLVLAHQVNKSSRRRSTRSRNRTPRNYASTYYRKTTTLKRVNNVISRIEGGIASRQSRIDDMTTRLESESDPIQISTLVRSLSSERGDQNDANARLQAANERKTEIETEENLLLESLNVNRRTGRASGRRRTS